MDLSYSIAAPNQSIASMYKHAKQCYETESGDLGEKTADTSCAGTDTCTQLSVNGMGSADAEHDSSIAAEFGAMTSLYGAFAAQTAGNADYHYGLHDPESPVQKALLAARSSLSSGSPTDLFNLPSLNLGIATLPAQLTASRPGSCVPTIYKALSSPGGNIGTTGGLMAPFSPMRSAMSAPPGAVYPESLTASAVTMPLVGQSPHLSLPMPALLHQGLSMAATVDHERLPAASGDAGMVNAMPASREVSQLVDGVQNPGAGSGSHGSCIDNTVPTHPVSATGMQSADATVPQSNHAVLPPVHPGWRPAVHKQRDQASGTSQSCTTGTGQGAEVSDTAVGSCGQSAARVQGANSKPQVCGNPVKLCHASEIISSTYQCRAKPPVTARSAPAPIPVPKSRRQSGSTGGYVTSSCSPTAGMLGCYSSSPALGAGDNAANGRQVPSILLAGSAANSRPATPPLKSVRFSFDNMEQSLVLDTQQQQDVTDNKNAALRGSIPGDLQGYKQTVNHAAGALKPAAQYTPGKGLHPVFGNLGKPRLCPGEVIKTAAPARS